jgi:integrase
VKAKRIAVNPVKGVENLPRKTAKRRVYLSADDVYRLADESGEHRALVLVLAYCGLRWGEAIGLRVRDVEFLGRRLTVSENAVQLGTRHAVGPTKGRKARSVPMPAFVLDELSAQCKGKASSDLVFPGRDRGYLQRPKSSTRMVPGRRQESQGAEDHAARPTPHVRVARRVGRGERTCAATDARAQVREGHTGHLRRLVRRRPRRRRGQLACPVLHGT